MTGARPAWPLLAVLGLMMSLAVLAASPVEEGFEASYLYKGNSAAGDEHFGDFEQLQGIANGDPAAGDAFWYFSRIEPVSSLSSETILFSVSYAEHLKNNFSTHPKIVRLPNAITHCNHIGDIDYHYHAEGDAGYLLAGLDNCLDGKGYIAIFRAADLNRGEETIVARAVIDVTEFQGSQVLWVCVDSAGKVYSGSGKEDEAADRNNVYRYDVDWTQIHGMTPEASPMVEVAAPTILKLFYPSGDPFIKEHWQGADFSTHDDYFYFAEGGVGYGYIHVFQRLLDFLPNALYRVRVSKDPCSPADPSCPDPDVYAMPFRFQTGLGDEPEGLSYFDMNDVEDLHLDMPRGELHAIVLFNDKFGDDSVNIKHYSAIVDVSPSESIADVYYHNPAWDEGIWDGAIIRLEPSEYMESLSLEGRRVKFVSWGWPGRSSLIR